MGRRLAFALARMRHAPAPPLPTVTVGMPALPRPRKPSRREVAAGAAVAAVALLAYVVARETTVFAVRSVDVAGAPADVAREVRTALRDVEGTSLVAADAAALERRLVALPAVRTAHVDRAFPHTLAVSVEGERALALLPQGGDLWVVAASGTVIRKTEAASAPPLPKLKLREPRSVQPGERLVGGEVEVALTVLRALPPRFPAAVAYVRPERDSVTLVLRGPIHLRLGPASDLGVKFASAAAVLRALPEAERRALAYLDVAVPQRPVAGDNTQVVSEG